MTFYILDPSFRDRGGHHFEFDATIASAARALGQNPVIVAHKDCTAEDANGAAVFPWFSHHIYEDKKSILGYGISNFLYFNASLYDDLTRLHARTRFGPADTILLPTLCENQFFGLARWASGFRSGPGPSLIVYLMFSPDFWPSHATLQAPGQNLTERALFYRWAFNCAATAPVPLAVFAGGRQIAREFSALAGVEIEPHPVPLSLVPAETGKGNDEQRTVLLFAGIAKRDKGFLFLADLADRLGGEYPDHHFLLHVDFSGLANSQCDMCAAFKKLQAVARPNIELLTGALKREDYIAFIKRAHCFVCTYDPVVYARKSSGVVWEAISLGLPILAPAGTFIQREAAEWGAGHHRYETWSAAGIAAAYHLFQKQVDELDGASCQAKERFRGANSADALADHLQRAARGARLPSSHRLPKVARSPGYLVLAWLAFRLKQKLRPKANRPAAA